MSINPSFWKRVFTKWSYAQKARMFYILARSYERDGFDTASAECYNHAANLGHVDSMCALGHLYSLGQGTLSPPLLLNKNTTSTSNKKQSVAESFISAARDTADNFVESLQKWNKSVANPYLSAVWYRRAAEKGHLEAQFNLALLYDSHSPGVVQNPYIHSLLGSNTTLFTPKKSFPPINWAKYAYLTNSISYDTYFMMARHRAQTILSQNNSNQTQLRSILSSLQTSESSILSSPPKILNSNQFNQSLKNPKINVLDSSNTEKSKNLLETIEKQHAYQQKTLKLALEKLDQSTDIQIIGPIWLQLYQALLKFGNFVLDSPWFLRDRIFEYSKDRWQAHQVKMFSKKNNLDVFGQDVYDFLVNDFSSELLLKDSQKYNVQQHKDIDALLKKYPIATKYDMLQYDSELIERPVEILNSQQMDHEAVYWYWILGVINGYSEGLYPLANWIWSGRYPFTNEKNKDQSNLSCPHPRRHLALYLWYLVSHYDFPIGQFKLGQVLIEAESSPDPLVQSTIQILISFDPDILIPEIESALFPNKKRPSLPTKKLTDSAMTLSNPRSLFQGQHFVDWIEDFDFVPSQQPVPKDTTIKEFVTQLWTKAAESGLDQATQELQHLHH